MDFQDSNTWYWIILALTGIVAGVLGYLFGKSDVPSAPDNFSELSKLDIENAKLRADLEICKKRLSATNTSKVSPKVSNKIAHTPTPQFNADAARTALGKKVKLDDLKIVEGIGPKIETLFHNFDIKTWKALSETSADTCQEVLDSGGKRFRIHDPASWPMQAKMAYEGHWEQLSEWQEKHRAGKF
ncbi:MULTISPECIES: hypothetical protein [Flavobacteriaceae]|uniref:hypothetical protein n=1 Tax=Flavobacteriaceae TaxID=49546 RepID=UPI00234BA499|nr:hypothetical protein [Muricauda sp. SP22]MDC6362278.1 hypothetical protein [Muricauda sp. SP22]